MSLLNSGGGSSPSKFSLNKGKNSPLFRRFKGFIKEKGLLDGVTSVLVALSGGPDSVCLLHLLYLLANKRHFQLHAAHFNHLLRGDEAERDALFAKRLCETNQIPFYLGSADVASFASEKKLSIQDAARTLRYRFLREIAETKGIDAVATGHTADDQAEELLLRFLRGSSLTGLSGIRPKRADGVIRPILFARKEDILSHLEKMGIAFVSDSTNMSDKYTRNRVRLTLLPLIEKEFNPSIVETLNRSAYLIQDDDDALADIAQKTFNLALVEIDKNENDSWQGVILKTEALLKAKPAILRRALLLAMERAGVQRGKILSDHLLKAEHLARGKLPSGYYSLPDDFCAIKIYRHLLIAKGLTCHLTRQDTVQKGDITIKGPGVVNLDEPLGKIVLAPKEISDIKKAVFKVKHGYPRTLYIRLDEKTFPLKLRQRKPGDRFRPLGFTDQVKLKDFLINRHIPKIIREAIPLLVHGSEIAAVCGVEISDEFKLEGGQALEIRWEPPPIMRILFSLVDT